MIEKRSVLFNILLIAWPFIFYIPLTSSFIVMGNDFDLIYYSYKKYIFEFWQDGQIPFWSPSEGAGFTLIYNPFAQFFYLPSWILFLICDLKNTFSLNDYLIFIIFGISIYSVGQYYWLKNLKVSSNSICLIVTLIVPMTLIVSNFIRLPNAIHTFCWLPYLLLGINYSFNKTKFYKSFLLIFFSSLFILTAGYPYFIVYIFIITFIYYILVFLINKNGIKYSILSILKCIFPASLSLIITSPWLYGVFKTLSLTQDRNLKSYEYATGHTFDYLDILGSWFYPVVSNTEGRYYFGIFFTFIIIIYFILFLKKRVTFSKKEKSITYFALISFLIITFLSISSQTILFKFLWEKIDFIQNMRTWPRINILFVPVLSLIAALAFKKILDYDKLQKFSNKEFYLLNISLVSILLLQIILFYLDIKDSYWFEWHEKRILFAKENLNFPLSLYVTMADGRINILSTLILILLLNFFLKNSFSLNLEKKKIYLFYSLILLTAFEQFINANLQWSLNKWKTPDTYKEYNANNILIKNFEKPRIKNLVHGNNYFRDNAFTINNFLNWGNRHHNTIFWTYYDRAGFEKTNLNSDEVNHLEIFFGLNKANKKIFLSANLNYDNPVSFVKESLNYEKKNEVLIEILDFSNNEIKIKFYSLNNGFLSYIDNFDPFWTAKLNGKYVNIEKLMNTYKSIRFKSGENIIILRYEPFNLKEKYFNIYSSL